jgi:hypothetical protein
MQCDVTDSPIDKGFYAIHIVENMEICETNTRMSEPGLRMPSKPSAQTFELALRLGNDGPKLP